MIRNNVDTSGDKIIEPEEVYETDRKEHATTANAEDGRSMTFTLKGEFWGVVAMIVLPLIIASYFFDLKKLV